jgi:hypothetical protein
MRCAWSCTCMIVTLVYKHDAPLHLCRGGLLLRALRGLTLTRQAFRPSRSYRWRCIAALPGIDIGLNLAQAFASTYSVVQESHAGLPTASDSNGLSISLRSPKGATPTLPRSHLVLVTSLGASPIPPQVQALQTILNSPWGAPQPKRHLICS